MFEGVNEATVLVAENQGSDKGELCRGNSDKKIAYDMKRVCGDS